MRRMREQVNIGANKPLGKWFEPMKYLFTGVSILVIIMSFIYKESNMQGII